MDGVEPDQMVRYLDVKVRPMNDSSRGLELELERESWRERERESWRERERES
jgi:hypothetical protein